MNQNLFIGNKVIKLTTVGSTNIYLKDLLSEKEKVFEGLVVVADDQTDGRGQYGNKWIAESGKNLTFSLLLKPSLKIDDQFLIAKMASLAIVDFLRAVGIANVTIKWPNDIYVDDLKIAGILIENMLKGSVVATSIVGIGLNVNQLNFNHLANATSMKLLKRIDFDLAAILDQLLVAIEKRYLLFKTNGAIKIDAEYLQNLYRFKQLKTFELEGKQIHAEITGVSSTGRLKLKIGESISEFDLKEIKFVI